MTDLRVTGIDPGPIPGIVELQVGGPRRQLLSVDVIQCNADVASTLVECLLENAGAPSLVQIERFVSRGRATADQSLTAAMVTEISALVDRASGNVILRTASQVKPWATDARLEAAGLLGACKGMRNARDAARHALYAAVHDAGLPDPLSKDWRR